MDLDPTAMMFVVRRPQELARKKDATLFMCFIDLTKAYGSVGRTLPWTILARFGIPLRMLAVIHQFHDGMRACVRLDSGECSDTFDVEQDLRQGCVLTPWLFSIFSRWCCMWRRNASPLMQSSWTAWCNSNERRKGEKGGGRKGRKSRRTEEGGGPNVVGSAVR